LLKSRLTPKTASDSTHGALQAARPQRRLPFLPSFFLALKERPGALVAFFFLAFGRDLAADLAGERQTPFHNRKLQLAFLRQDAIENHLHVVACAEASSVAFADNLVRVFAPCIAVVAQRIDRDQALDKKIGQLDKKAVLGGV